MNLQASYFRIGNPLRALDRLLHPFAFSQIVDLKKKPLSVRWTRRAEHKIQQRNKPLFVEMQLYFSCVVKKRVLFHDLLDQETVPVNSLVNVCFHTVQSTSCDPEEFAKNFPVKREFQSGAAGRMRASMLSIDYRDGQWCGEFDI